MYLAKDDSDKLEYQGIMKRGSVYVVFAFFFIFNIVIKAEQLFFSCF